MNSKRRRIRVLVVEDEPMIRDALRMQLIRDLRTTFFGAAEKPDDAIKMLESLRFGRESKVLGENKGLPDVILVDMRFRTPDGREQVRGYELIRHISRMRESTSDLDIKLLCLSSVLRPEVIIEAIAAGANGYLDKQHAIDGWIEAVDLVYKGFYVFSPNVPRQVMLAEKFTHIDKIEIFAPKEIELPDRAQDVAFLYWRGGLTAKEIGEELGISATTVRYHLKRVLNSDYMVVAFGGKISRKQKEQ